MHTATTCVVCQAELPCDSAHLCSLCREEGQRAQEEHTATAMAFLECIRIAARPLAKGRPVRTERGAA